MGDNNKIFALVTQAQQGDSTAFDKLYQHYLTPIFRYLYFKVSAEHIAEDLTQLVFLKAWQSLPRFQQRANPFSAWLYRIAKNVLVDYYRKHKAEIILPADDKVFTTIADQRPNAQQEIEQQEQQQKVRQAIQQLKGEQQEVIILKFINQLTTQEIAQLLNKKEPAIRALQYRALKNLRQFLK